MATWIPRPGDLAVELRKGTFDRDRTSDTVTVEKVTVSLVITSDGVRYHLRTLKPVSEGPTSPRELRPADDRRVLTVRARDQLAALAKTVDSLNRLDHRSPEEVVAALAQISAGAAISRNEVLDLIAGPSETRGRP